MLTWRNRNNLWYRYVQNTNNVKDKINNSKEEKTSIAMSIGKLDGGTTERVTWKPAGRLFVFIFNFAVADFAMATMLELVATFISWEMVVISVSWKECQKIDGRCGQDTDKHCTYSAVQPVHKRGTHRTRLAPELQCHLCALEKSLSSGLIHVSPFDALSPAVYHEHIFSLIHSSFYHDTWKHTTTGTTRSTPRTPSASSTSSSKPSRKASLSRRTTLVWKSAEWRKPAHELLHRLHHCMPRKLRGNPMQWSCRRERYVHNCLKPHS